MNETSWSELAVNLGTRGLAAPGAMPDTDPQAAIARFNQRDSECALEWLAGEFDLIPLRLARAACTTRAEEIFRRLARTKTSEEPWVPFGALGPLLLCAHYNPAARDLWEIPEPFVVRALVSESQYLELRDDLAARLAFNPPLVPSPELPGAEPPPRDVGLLTMLQWFLRVYPVTPEEREELLDSERAFAGNDYWRISDFKLLPKNYGVALTHIARGEAVFNPECAPSQSLFPDTLLEKHGVYPLYCGTNRVYLLTSERDHFAFEDEWLSTGTDEIQFTKILADRESIFEAIARNRGRGVQSAAEVVTGELDYSDTTNVVEIDAAGMQRLNPSSIHVTPEQIVHWVLYRAISSRASDLHVEKYFNMARFRARIDGELQVIHSCPEESLPRFISLIKNYSNMGHRRQDAQDARFAMSIGKRRIDCRVSAIPCRRDLQKLTVRFLDKQDGVRRLSELNLTQRQSTIINETMNRDQGLVLVTGPTGSGKTTSLYAFINSINREGINIHTIEDPIEYEIEGINQTQTDPINGIDFPQGLRRLLRADPDVILIGESRDEETANAAVNAALTGHLVLTTLHANDSLRALSRLISMGLPPYLLADALALSQAQRLVRRLCTYCKRPLAVSDDVRRIFEKNRVEIPPTVSTLYGKIGCSECNQTGYSGRIALMEMCPITPDLADLIGSNAPQSQMREIAFRHGVLSLYQEGLTQVLGGHTSMEEISPLSYTSGM
ncbi:MAG: GspE/PulE family protein [Terrimicrobiaceae bacterium]|nr:GspE/PulE family protein [Terrimicrobiaceae bacterium]